MTRKSFVWYYLLALAAISVAAAVWHRYHRPAAVQVENDRVTVGGRNYRLLRCLWGIDPEDSRITSVTRGSDGTAGGELTFWRDGAVVTTCSVAEE